MSTQPDGGREVGAPDIGGAVIAKLMRRVVPILAIGAILQGLSQLNVSFAGLEMTRDLGMSAAQFGFGSGIFFLSYLILGIPANLFLLKFGAKRWIAFAMFMWGLCSAALALSTSVGEFYALRIALGAAEAGFIPGILFIAGSWFPESHRGRVMSILLVCNPIAIMIGGPLSGFLLSLDGAAGLHGWQWVFIVEGLPASVAALFVLKALPASMQDAAWLTAAERDWLAATLAAERSQTGDSDRFSLGALVDPRVWVFSAIFFGVGMLPFGLIFFIPKIIESFGASVAQSAILSALPFASGAACMLLWGRSSDRTGERLYHALTALGAALLGCCVYILGGGANAVVGMIGLCLTFGGTFAFLPIFWTLPNRIITGAVAATGIAIINGIGGVAGILAPTAMGLLRDATGRYEAGTLLAVACASVSGLLLWWYGRRKGLAQPMAPVLAAD